MGKPDNYLKMEAVNNYLQSVERSKYSQFTIDFIEVWEYREEKDKTLKDTVLALIYEVENILQIIKETTPDYQFFAELRNLIGN